MGSVGVPRFLQWYGPPPTSALNWRGTIKSIGFGQRCKLRSSSQLRRGKPSKQHTAPIMEQTEVTKAETLDDLIKILHKLFESDTLDVDEVQSVMESYDTKPQEWMKYAKFDQYRYHYFFLMTHIILILRYCSI